MGVRPLVSLHPQHTRPAFQNRYDRRYDLASFVSFVMIQGISGGSMVLQRGDAQQLIHQGDAGMFQ